MTPQRTPGQPAGPAAASRRLPPGLWMPVAAVLLAAGGIVLLARGPGALDISWVAYTPLPQDGLPGGIMLFSRSMLAGALLVLAGAVLLAFWGGLQIGRRRPQPGSAGRPAGRSSPSGPDSGPDESSGQPSSG